MLNQCEIWPVALMGALLMLPLAAQAQTNPDDGSSGNGGDGWDCTAAPVDFTEEAGLTREERIDRMDQALIRSLSRFEECETSRADGASAGGGAAGGGSVGGGAPGGGDASAAAEGLSGEDTASGGPGVADAEWEGGVESVASPELSGEEAPDASVDEASESAISWDQPGLEGPADAADGGAEGAVVLEAPPEGLTNGKLPEDIPPADNDGVLEAQIRKAALEETDPELQKRLWNEYRRYKGLPQVE